MISIAKREAPGGASTMDGSISTPTVSTASADKFHHPYTPYDVQMQFMKTVYDVCERGQGQVGILESPTGTGKSLSLICGALTWLRQHKRSRYEQATSTTTAAATLESEFRDEPDWVIEQMLRRRRDALWQRWERREERLAAARQREEREWRMEEGEARRFGSHNGAKRRRTGDSGPGKKQTGSVRGREDEEDAEFLVGVDGDGDDNDPLSWLSRETRAMMEKAGLVSGKPSEGDDGDVDDDGDIDGKDDVKLTQFIAELRRPVFSTSLPSCASTHATAAPGSPGKPTTSNGVPGEPVKHVPLSSRQRLCINPAVSRLGSVAAINDRCTELQKPKAQKKKTKPDGSGSVAAADGRCPYVLTHENRAAVRTFRDTALATVPDIEDLFGLGRRLGVCPYYASRTAVPGAEIVTLPYPLLLQRAAREALGISLANSVVIIDEAHNLMDAVAGVHAAGIRRSELRRARKLLAVYVQRFGRKLSGENRVMVGQLGRVIQALSEWLDKVVPASAKAGSSSARPASADHGIVDATALLKHKGADQINLFALVQYIQQSKLAFKVESYAAYIEADEEGGQTADEQLANKHADAVPTGSGPVLHTLVSFLLALTNLSSEGRIFYETLPQSPNMSDVKLSYLLLSPTHAFSSVAAEARAVILAGGTMSPFGDYTTHLFPRHASDRITTLSCRHVVPPANLCVWTLASSRQKTPPAALTADAAFDFSFQKRSSRTMMQQLGIALLKLCTVVPDGVVVFFPSYGYLDEVVRMWQAPPGSATSPGVRPGAVHSGASASPSLPSPKTLWDHLQAKKAVFRETRGGSSDDILAAYSQAILGDVAVPHGEKQPFGASKPAVAHPSGALLLSVVGGKMSEGINFADRLGRCVVIVGLPFPNLHAPDWKARMEYVEATAAAAGSGSDSASDSRNVSPKDASRDFYENACMRAVNQSIGRAIRHRGDYAAIVLADHRFATTRIRSKLPAWIRDAMVAGSEDQGLLGMISTLGSFFRAKKS